MDEVTVLDASSLPAIRTPLVESPAAVYLARLGSVNSQRVMAVALQGIVDIVAPGSGHTPLTFPWQQIDYRWTSAIRAELARRYAVATARHRIAALKGVLQETWRLGLIDSETYHRAIDLKAIRGSTELKGRRIETWEITRLLATCDDTVKGTRDRALISLLRVCGLRRAEIVDIRRHDINETQHTILIRGKGNKERLTYVNDDGWKALNQWLDHASPEYVFTRVDKASRVYPDPLTPQAVQVILHKRCDLAGTPHCDPHDFRRTFCSDLLDRGIDISIVQKLMGHSDPSTTARYDRRGDAVQKSAVALLTL